MPLFFCELSRARSGSGWESWECPDTRETSSFGTGKQSQAEALLASGGHGASPRASGAALSACAAARRWEARGARRCDGAVGFGVLNSFGARKVVASHSARDVVRTSLSPMYHCTRRWRSVCLIGFPQNTASPTSSAPWRNCSTSFCSHRPVWRLDVVIQCHANGRQRKPSTLGQRPNFHLR